MQSTFKNLGIKPKIQDAIIGLGYENPTPVQSKCLPIILNGDDLLAQSQTGTGKTAAFALPILSKVDNSINTPQAMILVPTRELAIQVAESFKKYSKNLENIKTLALFGGDDYKHQLKSLKQGTHIIVGTPGRVMDHFRRGTIKTHQIKTVVLDEADEMLNMGFKNDIEWILSQIEHQHQTVLFSATMPKAISKIADEYLVNPKRVSIETTKQSADRINQYYININRLSKNDVLERILKVEDMDATIIFTRTKKASNEIADELRIRGYKVAALNGDIEQAKRKLVIDNMKNGDLDVIVATDVAARGIDIKRVSHVINYDVPEDTEAYTHRIGRTGRAGRTGKAFTLLTNKNNYFLRDLQRSKFNINRAEPPSDQEIKNHSIKDISNKVSNILKNNQEQVKMQSDTINQLLAQEQYTLTEVAAALLLLNPSFEGISSRKKSERQELSENRNHNRRDIKKHYSKKRSFKSSKSKRFSKKH